MFPLITEEKLREWANSQSREAQEQIVNLVYRLVSASCPNPTHRRFPLGDSINQPGPDGELSVEKSFEPFVPSGHSYWEIGTSKHVQRKATDDYRSRTEKTSVDKRSEATFVFVSPRSTEWTDEKRKDWIRDRVNRGEWKDIRVIDGTILIDWVRQFLPIESWLASVLSGHDTNQITTPELTWKVIESYGQSSPLTPGLFLNNRADAQTRLQSVLDGKDSRLRISTRYPVEGTDFVCAYLSSLEEDRRIESYGRCLMISDMSAWNTVCEQFATNPLVLIATSPLDLSGSSGNRAIQKANLAGHSVIFASLPGGSPDNNSVELKSPRFDQTRKSLMESGFSESRARELSDRCERRLGHLLGQLGSQSRSSMTWNDPDSSKLHFAILVGSWNDNSEADQQFISRLAGIKFSEWSDSMKRLSRRQNPPVTTYEGEWRIVGRFERWWELGDRLHNEDLEMFYLYATQVLAEPDPKFTLPPKERMMSSIRGLELQHSHQMRKGIAESLALLGSHPKALTSCSPRLGSFTARRSIFIILGDADWQRWASLLDLLPLLAEAAPDEFLDAVEDAIAKSPSPFDVLFAEEGTFPLGTSYVSGLLWALESLAWGKNYMRRVCNLLSHLASRDPGGEWANRPSRSLANVLSPFLPQTVSSVDSRIETVKEIIHKYPSVAWSLLSSLIQTKNIVLFPSHQPTWLDLIDEEWKDNAFHVIDSSEVHDQIDAFSKMYVDMACKEFDRIIDKEFFHHFPALPNQSQMQIIDHLSSPEIDNVPEEKRTLLWKELSRFIRFQNEFSKDDQFLTGASFSRLKTIVKDFAPLHFSTINPIIFSSDAFLLYDKQDDWNESERIANNHRQKAVKDLMVNGDVEDVIELSLAVENPFLVGESLGMMTGETEDALILPSLFSSEQEHIQQFARGYVRGRWNHQKWEWVDNLNTSGWTTSQKTILLCCLPFDENTWQRAEVILKDKVKEYWTNVRVRPHHLQEEMSHAIDKLIGFGRPVAAIFCIRVALLNKTFYRDEAIQALLFAANSQEEKYESFQYDVGTIIERLQSDLDRNDEILWHIELLYLPILDHIRGYSPVTLETRLASDPKFYCDIIQKVFLPQGVSHSKEQLDEEQSILKRLYFELLGNWRTPPGLQPDNSFSSSLFTSWLEQVKRISKKSGHFEIAIEQLGEVLVYCPPDPNGLWIPFAVAQALDNRENDAMRRGYSIGTYNLRGAHIIDPTGSPEIKLATQYRQKADQAYDLGLPHLARTMRIIADEYDREAEKIVANEEYKL